MSPDKRNTLAEIITVFAEVRRVARQLEADKKVTLSRAPRLLLELNETLKVLSGTMTVAVSNFYDAHDAQSNDETENHMLGSGTKKTTPSIPSSAESCRAREETREITLHKSHAREMAHELSKHIEERFSTLWKPVSSSVIYW